MLTNIINTLAITCSLGASINNAPKPNKANNTTPYTYTINWGTQTQIQDEDPYIVRFENWLIQNSEEEYTQTKCVQEGNINNSYITGTAKRIMLQTSVEITYNQQNTTYANIIGMGERELQPKTQIVTDINNEQKTLYVSQELYIFKIEGLQNQINPKLEINASYGPFINGTFKNYGKLLTTTNKEMENVLQWNNKNYFKNNNLYDGLSQIIYTTSGLTSSVSEGIYDTTQTSIGLQRYSQDLSTNIPITIQTGRINYYVFYTELRRIQANQTDQITITNQPTNYNYLLPYFNETGTNNAKIKADIITANVEVEVINIPGIMFDVLGMPFTFISTAFNLTLFPGTPYELNISVLFLSIVAVIIFVFLIKFILGRFR